MTRAAIYTRVSEAHGPNETSTDRQLALCKAYAESQGWDVVQHYTDLGISAYKRVDRPGWRKVLADVEAGRTDVVLVHALDRAGRNAADLLKFVETCRDRGVRFASATQPIDTGSSYGGIIIAVLAAVAEVESAVKRERALSKVAQLQADGLWAGGGRPFGFTVKDGRLVPDAREAELVRKAVERFLAGTSLRSVARGWNDAGITGPQGGTNWTAGTVRRVLENERHVGTTLTRRDHNRILTRLAKNAAEVAGYQRSTTYMLTGLLACGVCGEKMAGRPSRGNREYICRRTGTVHLTIPAEFVEELVTRRASAVVTAADTAVVDPATLSAPLLAALDDLERRMDDFAQAAATGGMDAGRIRRGLAPLEAERDRVQADLDAVAPPLIPAGSWAELLADVDEPSPVEWRAYLEQVVDRVEIGPAAGAPSRSARVRITFRDGVREAG